MKIGLEFEGLLLKDSKVVRWSQIPRDQQFRIKCNMDMMQSELDPCDYYDCLAEVRTDPIVNPTVHSLLDAWMDQIALANKSFKAEGYDIVWAESAISPAMHSAIVKEIALSGRPKKDVFTIVDGRVVPYLSRGNLFRGGGLHINVSSVHPDVAVAMALEMHACLYRCIDSDFRSNYRKNMLFRKRQDLVTGEFIAEYMSMGYNFYDDPEAVKKAHPFNTWETYGWLKHVVDVGQKYSALSWNWPKTDEHLLDHHHIG